jgi:hypothetical protein
MSRIWHLFEGLARFGAMNQKSTPEVPSVEAVKREHNLDDEVLQRLARSEGWDVDAEHPALEKLGIGVDGMGERQVGVVPNLGRIAVAGIIFASSVVFVVGGILEGHSALFGEQRALAFACLSALLIALAVFEGLQICVTLLRFKDFEFFADFERVAELHRLFRSEVGTRRFLAGRQFFVVFLVFFIARITTFPELRHVPLVGIALPTQLEPLWYGFFDLGLMGAFLVLWIAQLAPQFGANRDPLAFLSFPGMGLALRSSFFIDDLGLTLPGLWFSSWVRERKELLNSKSERFRLASEEEIDAAALLVRRSISQHGSSVVIKSEKRLKLAKGGLKAFEDESLVVDTQQISGSALEFELVRQGVTMEVFGHAETRRVEPTVVHSLRVSPKTGVFENGDVVVLAATVTCDDIWEHSIEVTEPTRLVHVMFAFDLGRAAVPGEVTVQRADPRWPERTQESRLSLSADGTMAVAEYFCVFPRLGEIFCFSWKPLRRPSAPRIRGRSGRCLSSQTSRWAPCPKDAGIRD